MEERKNKVTKTDDIYFIKVISFYVYSTRLGFLIFQETSQEVVASKSNRFVENHFVETPLPSMIELSKQKLFF